MPNSQSKRIALLRFLGYISVSYAGLIIPLLVFTLTQSLAMAGLSLMLEWLPKVVIYWWSGPLINRITPAKAHVALELGRILSLFGLLGCSYFQGPAYFVGICAALFQCCNAVSNVIFELLVVQWWPPVKQATGHSLMTKKGIEAGAIATLSALFIQNISIILILAIIVQSVVAYLVYQYRAQIHTVVAPQPLGVAEWAKPLKVMRTAPSMFWIILLIAIAYTLPATVVSSGLPFLLATFYGTTAVTLAYGYRVVQILANVLWMVAIQKYINQHPQQSAGLAVMGCGFILISSVCLIAAQLGYGGDIGIIGALAGMLWLGVSLAFISPWFRLHRQHFVSNMETLDPGTRYTYTGILISAEAVSPVILGAALFFGGNLVGVLGVAVLAGVVFILYLRQYQWLTGASPTRTIAESNLKLRTKSCPQGLAP